MNASGGRLNVLIDARFQSGIGGVEQFVIGLATGLRTLPDDATAFVFLGYDRQTAWLEPHLGERLRLVTTPPPKPRRARLKEALPRAAQVYDALRAARTRAIGDRRPVQTLPPTPEIVVRERPDVIHFTWPVGFRTTTPSIYHPWDLQHRHLPQFFTARQRAERDLLYSAMSHQASTVCVATEWGKRDVISELGLPKEKVIVVPVDGATAAYAPVSSAVVARVRNGLNDLGVPGPFAFFPAQTWPHKNHARLFAALAVLRKRGVRVPLICSGRHNEFFPQVERAARDAQVSDQVTFLGFVPPDHLQSLYALARLLVFPSLFEGWGFPVTEAMRAGVPVACSNVTSLPENASGAALLFDPTSVDDIADAMERLWTNESLRRELGDAGRRRAAEFSWERTARTFCDHYQLIAARTSARTRDALAHD
jgi:glycosyltransferase involved in cell wall biosynthesis